jgi:hypothetical protein
VSTHTNCRVLFNQSKRLLVSLAPPLPQLHTMIILDVEHDNQRVHTIAAVSLNLPWHKTLSLNTVQYAPTSIHDVITFKRVLNHFGEVCLEEVAYNPSLKFEGDDQISINQFLNVIKREKGPLGALEETTCKFWVYTDPEIDKRSWINLNKYKKCGLSITGKTALERCFEVKTFLASHHLY